MVCAIQWCLLAITTCLGLNVLSACRVYIPPLLAHTLGDLLLVVLGTTLLPVLCETWACNHGGQQLDYECYYVH